jgi:hypothetical protein
MTDPTNEMIPAVMAETIRTHEATIARLTQRVETVGKAFDSLRVEATGWVEKLQRDLHTQTNEKLEAESRTKYLRKCLAVVVASLRALVDVSVRSIDPESAEPWWDEYRRRLAESKELLAVIDTGKQL